MPASVDSVLLGSNLACILLGPFVADARRPFFATAQFSAICCEHDIILRPKCEGTKCCDSTCHIYSITCEPLMPHENLHVLGR